MLSLFLLAPLTLADLPPLLDYPNHLARLFVLAFGSADPVLQRFYQPHWAIIPNLALDLTVPPLLHVLPVHLAGRLVIGLILLLPVLGATAYHRALSGRMSYWPLASVLFVYNAALLRGFLNFIASVGLALLFAAAWLAWRESRPSRAVLTAIGGAIVLFFCHLTGLLFFAVLIGAYETARVVPAALSFDRCGSTGPVIPGLIPGTGSGTTENNGPLLVAGTSPAMTLRERGSRLSSVTCFRRAAVCGLIFIIPAMLYAVSDLKHTGGAIEFRSVAEKAKAALFPVINYLWPLDLATAVLCVVVPVLCVVRHWCVIPLQAAIALGGLAGLFLMSPHGFKGTFDLDTRFIIMAAVLLPAALVPVAIPCRSARVLCAGFLALFAIRMTVVMTVWHLWAADLAAFRAVIASVGPGDVVLTVRLPRGWESGYWRSLATARRLSDGTVVDGHLAALLLIEHRAWWPYLFDNPSQQPIETREPFRALAELVDASHDPIASLTWGVPEMRVVTHVLVMGPSPTPGLIGTEGLERVAGNQTAVLFAVKRLTPSAPVPPPPGR